MKKRFPILLAFVLFGLALALIPLGAGATRASAPTGTARHYEAPKVTPGDWPMMGHDVSRTNYNPDETIIGPSTVNSLVQAWQGDLAPEGQRTNAASSSAPSVANGKVYVGSNSTSASNFFSFDAVSGSLVYTANLHYTNRCFNVGIGSTAAISGSVVTVGGSDSAFYGLDASTGQILWRNAMNAGSSAFAWESPLCAYGRSYLGIASDCDNPSVRGEVRAVDTLTGNQVNNQYFVPAGSAGAGIWNSPALSPDGSILVVGTGEDYSCGGNCQYTRAMVSLDPLTLQILQWNQQGNTGQDLDYGTTPVIFHDSQGRTLVGANHKDGWFYTYDITNIQGGPIWSKNTGTSVGAMPAYDPTDGNGGTLFIGGGGANLYAVDPATGQDRAGFNAGAHSYHGNMAIANGLLFFNQGTSGLHIVDEHTGADLHSLNPPTGTGGPANSGVAISNGYIYWVSGRYLNAWHVPGATPGPTNTATSTPIPTYTATRTSTSVSTHTATPSNTPTSTQVLSPTPTPTGTLPTATDTPTVTLTPVVTATATGTVCAITFTDVSPSDYFYQAVTYLYCHGAISGYAENTFRPYNDTTRGQLSKIVVLAEGWQIDTTGGPHFTDVPTTHPFYQYIETAYNHGIITGYADNTFRPYNNITRGQLTKVIVLADNWSVTPPSQPTFRDVPTNDPFYGYIETAYSHNVISGYSCGTSCLEFRPGNNATRGQISKIVYLAVTTP